MNQGVTQGVPPRTRWRGSRPRREPLSQRAVMAGERYAPDRLRDMNRVARLARALLRVSDKELGDRVDQHVGP